MSSDKQAVSTITIAELIPSKDVREYLLEKGRVFTDFERATLIYNHSGMGFTEKAAHLKELMEQTTNTVLKEEIHDRLSYDEDCLSRFYENNGDFLYILEVYEPEDDTSYEQGYFKTGEAAVTYGKKFKENFSVQKIRFMTAELETDDCRNNSVSTIYFNNQGLIRGYYSLEVDWTAKKSEIDSSRFENAYVSIPHPFSNGDFVRVKNNGQVEDEICIVECMSPESDEDSERQKYFDYSDASLRVAYLYGDARFGHEHVKIADVEFARLEEGDSKYELLHGARSLIEGHGGLADFQFLCDEYCRTQESRR